MNGSSLDWGVVQVRLLGMKELGFVKEGGRRKEWSLARLPFLFFSEMQRQASSPNRTEMWGRKRMVESKPPGWRRYCFLLLAWAASVGQEGTTGSG